MKENIVSPNIKNSNYYELKCARQIWDLTKDVKDDYQKMILYGTWCDEHMCYKRTKLEEKSFKSLYKKKFGDFCSGNARRANYMMRYTGIKKYGTVVSKSHDHEWNFIVYKGKYYYFQAYDFVAKYTEHSGKISIYYRLEDKQHFHVKNKAKDWVYYANWRGANSGSMDGGFKGYF